MTYIDSSVALAYLLAESRAPSASFLQLSLVSSRLLEYEVLTRLNAKQVGEHIENGARSLLAGIELVELSRDALRRALEPWPISLRTLDALHLATADYLRASGEHIELASYDSRLLAAAQAVGIAVAPL
jgi:hypothetical protein